MSAVRVRALALALVAAALALCGCGCGGGASKPANASSTQRYLNDSDHDPHSDQDGDNLNGNTTDEDHDGAVDHINPEDYLYHDKDDSATVGYGHQASVSVTTAVAAVVKSYYAAAVSGQGATACSLIAPGLAQSIPEDYARAPGPAYLRGAKSCPIVMSLLFGRIHARLTTSFVVTDVRLEGEQAIALLGSATMPASKISLQREHGVWWIDALIGTQLE